MRFLKEKHMRIRTYFYTTPERYVKTESIIYYYVSSIKYIFIPSIISTVLLISYKSFTFVTEHFWGISVLWYLASITIISLYLVGVIFENLLFPPYNLRMAYHLDYVKEYVNSRKGILTHEEKKNISSNLGTIKFYLPMVVKKAEYEVSELDNELNSRFSFLEKDIADIFKICVLMKRWVLKVRSQGSREYPRY